MARWRSSAESSGDAAGAWKRSCRSAPRGMNGRQRVGRGCASRRLAKPFGDHGCPEGQTGARMGIGGGGSDMGPT